MLPEGAREASESGINRAWRKIARTARRQGWCIFINGTGKLEWRGPNGERTITAATPPGNGRNSKNYLMQLKRAGVPGA